MTSQYRRIEQLRGTLADQNFDGMLVTNLTNIRYLTGFSGSAALLLVLGDSSHFFTDGRYLAQAPQQVTNCEIYFDLPADSPRKHRGLSGLLHNKKLISLDHTIAFEADSLSVSHYRKYEKLFEGVTWRSTAGTISRQAMVKDATELTALKEAIRITDAAFSELLPSIKIGAIEREVAARLSYLLRMNGSEKDSFEPIVASGARSALPHARPSEKAFDRGDFVVLDFGAVTSGYHADMTRTICVGEASDRHHEIYDIVLQSQLAGIAAVEAGVPTNIVDAASRDIIEARGYGEQYVHGTGHGIGLEVHTPPSLSRVSEDVLEAGMVVTVEPGIYIGDWGGVRIEDDVLVLPDGRAPLNQSTKELLVLG